MAHLIKSHRGTAKHVICSKNFNRYAIVWSNGVTLFDKDLNSLYKIRTTENILSGYFNEHEVLIYTTHKHLKYIIDEDSFGIIASLEQPLYVICVANGIFHYVDRDGKIGNVKVNMEEYTYKMNVKRKRVSEIGKQLARGDVVGALAIRHLERQGLPDLALSYEKDEANKFKLAIASGNLDVALLAAIEIKRKDCFSSLAIESIKKGNLQIAEVCYQKMLAFDKLTFLYLLTGNVPKLEKMVQLAKNKLKDPMIRYQIAVVLGDVTEQVKLLAEVGHITLAYTLAKKHNLRNLMVPLGEAIAKNIKLNQAIIDVIIILIL